MEEAFLCGINGIDTSGLMQLFLKEMLSFFAHPFPSEVYLLAAADCLPVVLPVLRGIVKSSSIY